MTEEKGVKNGEAASEMAPQEDGTKVPLTDNACAEVKFTSSEPANGDAKIDMGSVPVFQGLTKDELMKYSDDPFWVRLRMFLFVLFWAGWLAMLVVAIVIIVQAPRCAPQEKREWIQESAILQYDNRVDVDNSGDINPNDLVEMAKVLGLTSVYIEDLINPEDFTTYSTTYTEDDLNKIINTAQENGLKVVTDFIPRLAPSNNTWFKNDSLKDFFKPNSNEFDFSNSDLLEAVTDVLSKSWVARGVQAFLMQDASTNELLNARDVINENLKTSVDGAVVSNVVDMGKELVTGLTANMFQQFLNENLANWTYYKFNPKVAESQLDQGTVHLLTVSLFLVPGTPILSGLDKPYLDDHKDTIKALSDLRREKDSIKIGSTPFLNTTEPDVIAYARMAKNNPGYAVAVNLSPVNNATLDFTSIPGVEGSGDVSLKATADAVLTQSGLGKQDLSGVFLGPQEGVVIQFVPA